MQDVIRELKRFSERNHLSDFVRRELNGFVRRFSKYVERGILYVEPFGERCAIEEVSRMDFFICDHPGVWVHKEGCPIIVRVTDNQIMELVPNTLVQRVRLVQVPQDSSCGV